LDYRQIRFPFTGYSACLQDGSAACGASANRGLANHCSLKRSMLDSARIMSDYLAPLKEPEVAAFYRRLAIFIQGKFGGDSLAATLLLYWLDGGGKDKTYPAKYVQGLDEVRDYLRGTARPIFLSKRATPSGAIGGVLPRIRGTIKTNPQTGPYAMHLEGNVETPLSVEAKAAMGMKVDERELDALYALHGFTLVSDVVASVSRSSNSKIYDVTFDSWKCKAVDYYHWNPAKHITVPNPDFGSKEPGAVRPGDKEITVYHSNAIRVEKAGLAAPFHDESEPWDEKDVSVMGPAQVNV
jgi:hypothetical protein